MYDGLICFFCVLFFFFFKQKTAYDMRISDWSSDVCSSDLWRSASLCVASLHHATARPRRKSVRRSATPKPGPECTRAEKHVPDQGPAGHRQAEQAPVDLGTFAGTGEHITDDIAERKHLKHVRQPRAAGGNEVGGQ